METGNKFVITPRMAVMIFLWACIFAVIVWALSGCSKEEPISRVAEYYGTWEYSTPYYQQSDRYAYRKIIKEEGYIITTNWSTGELQTANYTSNGYEYQPFEVLSANSCEMQFVTISGRGRFIGDSLYEEGELIFTTSSYTYKGTWSAKLKKQ
jgi:hypothetical protein